MKTRLIIFENLEYEINIYKKKNKNLACGDFFNNLNLWNFYNSKTLKLHNLYILYIWNLEI